MPPDPVATFEAQPPRLLRLAYRMLGSNAEAEDIVQDAFLRWHGATGVENAAAWLTRNVSRLCLDQMKSARAWRETYPGTWLPEPLIELPDDALRPDNLTLSLMMALERLSLLERAAFLLHAVFGKPRDEVATIIECSPGTRVFRGLPLGRSGCPGRDAGRGRKLACRWWRQGPLLSQCHRWRSKSCPALHQPRAQIWRRNGVFGCDDDRRLARFREPR